MFAYYDRLSTKIEDSANDSGDTVESSTETKSINYLNIIENRCTSSADIPSAQSQTTPTSQTTLKNRNFRILSHNVQRIISNSNSAVNHIDLSNNFGLDPLCRSHNKKSSSKLKHPVINIPLSKNTSKLAQAGNDLVESIESNKNGNLKLNATDEDNNRRISIIKDEEIISKNLNFDNIFEKTINYSSPNETKNSEYRCEKKTLRSNKIRKIVEKLQTMKSIPPADDTNVNENQNNKMNNKEEEKEKEVINQDEEILKTDSSDEQFEDCIAEANNFLVKIPVQAQAQLRLDDSISKDELNDLKKLIENKTNSLIKKTVTVDTNLEKMSNDTGSNTKPADGGQDLKSNEALKQRLKSRPLSASSICSTSSTSSSGSERLAGKSVVSYLASVESLADENELTNSGLTLCERACMEIVDSEKSYVEDLRQVIKGYLTDWREGACLRTDDLKILFSNIEEVYKFNSFLLAELVESQLDPVKIAKCFIQFKDRFEVYTTYW